MPGNILAVDTGFPELNQGSPEEKISALAGYVYQLLEQLRYTLNNLGQDNFNDTELKGLEKLFTGPLTVRVEETEKGMAKLEITAEGITATVQNLRGDLSSIRQTVEGLRICTKTEDDVGISALSGMSLYFLDETGDNIIGRVNMDNNGSGVDESTVRMFVGTGTDYAGRPYSLKLESAGNTSYEGKENVYIKATAGNISINGKKTVKISAGAGSSRLEIGNGVISFNGQQLATLPALSDLIDARLKAHRLIS